MPPKIKILFAFSFLFLTAFQNKQSYTVKDIADPKKSGGGYVSNPDHILDEESVQSINNTLAALDQSGEAQVAVVIVKSIGNEVPKDFAVELFQHWAIGNHDTDNGLLILLVKDQHRVEFETGYGLEGILTDVMCHRIQEEQMIPLLKQNDFNNALLQGVLAVADQLNTPESNNQDYDSINNNTPYAYDTAQYTYPYDTLEEKKANAWGAVVVILESFFSLIFYFVVSFIALSGDMKTKEYKNKMVPLFTNSLFKSVKSIIFFLIVVPLSGLEVIYFITGEADIHPSLTLLIYYLTWCLLAHIYFLLMMPFKVAASKPQSRHEQYERLSEVNRHLKWFAWIFPLPFLLVYWLRHKKRMDKLRNAPYKCQCGTMMTKMDEVSDDFYLNNKERVEEKVNSIDYDVWVCHFCQRQLIFDYEDYNSKVRSCNKCSAKTLVQKSTEEIEAATYTSDGWGYKNFVCSNCQHEEKIKYVVPKKRRSSSGSSGFGSSSSSGGGSWGGGSSGGGGSGGSW